MYKYFLLVAFDGCEAGSLLVAMTSRSPSRESNQHSPDKNEVFQDGTMKWRTQSNSWRSKEEHSRVFLIRHILLDMWRFWQNNFYIGFCIYVF